jgi:hypothetical protein
MKVWYSENEFVEYSSNRDPERFLVNPRVLNDEKLKLEIRIAEINQHLDFILDDKQINI